MKNLFLMRHGKSSWELNVKDQDRSLLLKGIHDVQLIGSELFKSGFNVDQVYSSPANRAAHTATICLRELHIPIENCQLISDLYDFTGDDVQRFIKSIDDKVESVMIFGHNHAFTHIANLLGDKHIDNVPTSGLVHIQFQEDAWANISKGITVKTLFPKDFKTW